MNDVINREYDLINDRIDHMFESKLSTLCVDKVGLEIDFENGLVTESDYDIILESIDENKFKLLVELCDKRITNVEKYVDERTAEIKKFIKNHEKNQKEISDKIASYSASTKKIKLPFKNRDLEVYVTSYENYMRSFDLYIDRVFNRKFNTEKDYRKAYKKLEKDLYELKRIDPDEKNVKNDVVESYRLLQQNKDNIIKYMNNVLDAYKKYIHKLLDYKGEYITATDYHNIEGIITRATRHVIQNLYHSFISNVTHIELAAMSIPDNEEGR